MTEDLITRASELLARLGIVVVVIIIFVSVGRLANPLVRRLLDRRGRPSYTRVFSAMIRAGFALLGSLFAITLAFPSVRVADVLAIFGIVSVAAGFAFKDTFENLLAGVMLVRRDPFHSGDHVVIADRDGIVEGVTVRETVLRSAEGRRFYIPNSRVMTGVIEVRTHDHSLRQTVTVRLSADAELAIARAAAVDAMHNVSAVHTTPPPEALLTDLVDGKVELSCRFWSSSVRSEAASTRDQVIEALLTALAAHGVALPVEHLDVRLLEDRAPGSTPHGEIP